MCTVPRICADEESSTALNQVEWTIAGGNALRQGMLDICGDEPRLRSSDCTAKHRQCGWPKQFHEAAHNRQKMNFRAN